MLNEQIYDLKEELVYFSSIVEQMVTNSVSGLLKNSETALKNIIAHEELRVNRIELELEDKCTTLIAQFEPKAKNLRSILMILKMINDFERMGDLAVNISESGLFLLKNNLILKHLPQLRDLQKKTTEMFKDSVLAFINEDTGLAVKVCESDNSVDNLRDEILKSCIATMKSDPSKIEDYIHFIRITRTLERIADLSTNIAEDVMYMVEGKVIKHHKAE